MTHLKATFEITFVWLVFFSDIIVGLRMMSFIIGNVYVEGDGVADTFMSRRWCVYILLLYFNVYVE